MPTLSSGGGLMDGVTWLQGATSEFFGLHGSTKDGYINIHGRKENARKKLNSSLFTGAGDIYTQRGDSIRANSSQVEFELSEAMLPLIRCPLFHIRSAITLIAITEAIHFVLQEFMYLVNYLAVRTQPKALIYPVYPDIKIGYCLVKITSKWFTGRTVFGIKRG